MPINDEGLIELTSSKLPRDFVKLEKDSSISFKVRVIDDREDSARRGMPIEGSSIWITWAYGRVTTQNHTTDENGEIVLDSGINGRPSGISVEFEDKSLQSVFLQFTESVFYDSDGFGCIHSCVVMPSEERGFNIITVYAREEFPFMYKDLYLKKDGQLYDLGWFKYKELG